VPSDGTGCRRRAACGAYARGVTAETPLDVPRAWLELPDPAGAGDPAGPPAQVVRVDVTWLTSRWTCIFGRGCLGIDAARPDAGCCTLGAHFADADDERRVARAARRLDDGLWQRRRAARRSEGGWVEVDEDGARRTRVVDGACVFFNDEGFPGGYGCALHHLAAHEGVSPVRTKPDVCWQLPLRRTYREVERPDGSSYLEVTIGEYDRRGWGPGGADLDWYCTGSPLAHVAAEPVYRSMEVELRELVGDEAYEMVAAHCDAVLGARRRLPLTVHPATAAATRARGRRRSAP
jgi:hypothetical protein